jgi:hypothetical protein
VTIGQIWKVMGCLDGEFLEDFGESHVDLAQRRPRAFLALSRDRSLE